MSCDAASAYPQEGEAPCSIDRLSGESPSSFAAVPTEPGCRLGASPKGSAVADHVLSTFRGLRRSSRKSGWRHRWTSHNSDNRSTIRLPLRLSRALHGIVARQFYTVSPARFDYRPSSRGSRASRNPLPIKLIDNAVTKIASPGKKTFVQFER